MQNILKGSFNLLSLLTVSVWRFYCWTLKKRECFTYLGRNAHDYSARGRCSIDRMIEDVHWVCEKSAADFLRAMQTCASHTRWHKQCAVCTAPTNVIHIPTDFSWLYNKYLFSRPFFSWPTGNKGCSVRNDWKLKIADK